MNAKLMAVLIMFALVCISAKPPIGFKVVSSYRVFIFLTLL